jgi:hypothetical protein
MPTTKKASHRLPGEDAFVPVPAIASRTLYVEGAAYVEDVVCRGYAKFVNSRYFKRLQSSIDLRIGLFSHPYEAARAALVQPSSTACWNWALTAPVPLSYCLAHAPI